MIESHFRKLFLTTNDKKMAFPHKLYNYPPLVCNLFLTQLRRICFGMGCTSIFYS